MVPSRVHRLVPAGLRADARHRLGLWSPGDTGYVPVPPAPAVGEHTGPPDAVVVGVPDAGALWWLRAMAAHPDVAPVRMMTEASHFFAPYATRTFGDDDIARFHEFFPRRSGRTTLHWSPDGLAYPWETVLLARAAPAARIVVLVRDPIDRLLDGLAHTVDGRPSHPGTYLSDAVERGFYASQLDHLHRVYPPEQVLVLQYERCVADPTGALERTHEFIGLPPTGPGRPAAPPLRPAHAPLETATIRRLRQMYEADVDELARRTPGFDRSLWPHFATDT